MSLSVLDDVEEFVDRKDFVGLEGVLDYLYSVHVEEKDVADKCYVISPPYKFHKCLQVVNFILSKTSPSSSTDENILKTLKVAQVLLNHLCPRIQNHRLHVDMMRTDLHQKFIGHMTQVVGYTESEDIRRLGISVFKSYLWAFDAAGRFSILQFLFHTVDHVGLVGYMITQLKDFVLQALSHSDCDNNNPFPYEACPTDMAEWFLGKNLQRVSESIFNLQGGAKTDLMQYYDKIISALNLLLFLFLRDGKVNRSGIVNYLPTIDEKLLKPLRAAIDLTSMHYKLKIREQQDPTSASVIKKPDYELCLNQVGGERIKGPEEYTPEEHIESYNNVLKQLDMMECVLARVMASHP